MEFAKCNDTYFLFSSELVWLKIGLVGLADVFTKCKIMDKPVLMSVVQSLLDNQAKNFKTTIELITGDLRNEIKELRKEVSDLKISLQFSQAKQEEMAKKVELLEKKTDANEESVNQSFDYIEAMEDNVEYIHREPKYA